MKTSLLQALQLLLSGSDQLNNIISVTLKMGLSSSLIALLIGMPLGILLGMSRFRGRTVLVVLNRTLMGLPPVVCGLICYMLFSGVGPLRHLKLLYTVRGMIIAQIILLVPLVIGNLEAHVAAVSEPVRVTCRGLSLRRKTLLLLINECRYQILYAYLFALGRAFAEVGAVSMVGGAIAYKTNVMTTAIMNYSNMGNFTLSLALGIILMGISLLLNTGAAAVYYYCETPRIRAKGER